MKLSCKDKCFWNISEQFVFSLIYILKIHLYLLAQELSTNHLSFNNYRYDDTIIDLKLYGNSLDSEGFDAEFIGFVTISYTHKDLMKYIVIKLMNQFGHVMYVILK